MLKTTARLRQLVAGLLCAVAASTFPGAGQAAEPLRAYGVEPGNVTVSGISSGAYMAVHTSKEWLRVKAVLAEWVPAA